MTTEQQKQQQQQSIFTIEQLEVLRGQAAEPFLAISNALRCHNAGGPDEAVARSLSNAEYAALTLLGDLMDALRVECAHCEGTGVLVEDGERGECVLCEGMGFVDRIKLARGLEGDK